MALAYRIRRAATLLEAAQADHDPLLEAIHWEALLHLLLAERRAAEWEAAKR